MNTRSLALAAALSAASAQAGAMKFVDDDYAAARAQAKEGHKPVFIEVWAPW
jgi:hypothetical protein